MKKRILLLLTSITFTLAAILTGCSNPNLPGGGGMSGTNDSGTVRFSWNDQAGSRSSSGRNGLSRANTIQDAAKVVISIEAADGTAIYSQKQLSLFNFNGSFISEPLSLKVGSYRLTEYLVLNQAGTVIYATPKEGSKQAHLVADPLPINFAVTKDNTTKVIPEVVDVTEVTPADFGYATFSFAEAKVFNFLVAVMVYDASADNFILTDATMDVTAGAKSYSFNLAPLTNMLALNDMSTDYSLTITKRGYETHRVSYTNAELKAFFQTPLLVTLSKKESPPSNIITFVDPNLETEVRNAIRKPTGDIYKSDVAALARLMVGGKVIKSLSGIEHLTSLTYLQLYSCSISDLGPLSTMSQLTKLNLNENSITDLTPLASLTNLTDLYLNNNNISDIGPLAAMTKMRELYLHGNQISDISALAEMREMNWLSLHSNKITGTAPLSSMTKVTTLYLQSNSLTEVTGLSTLTSLTALRIDLNKISDLSPLVNNAGVDTGDYLNLTGNPLSTDAQNVQLPALKAKGVNVVF